MVQNVPSLSRLGRLYCPLVLGAVAAYEEAHRTSATKEQHKRQRRQQIKPGQVARDEGARWCKQGGRAGRHWGPNQGGNLISVAAKTLPDHATSATTTATRTRSTNAKQNAQTAKSKTQKLFCYLCGQFAANHRRRAFSTPQESSRERVAFAIVAVGFPSWLSLTLSLSLSLSLSEWPQ